MNYKFKIFRIGLFLMYPCSIFLFSCSEENEKREVEIETEIVPTSECETAFSQGINVMSEGERTTISFSTNKDWSVSLAETQSGDHWCTVSPSSGKAGNVTLTILVTSNAGYDDRNVVLKISADELTKNIIINQKQKDALTLTSDRFEVDKDGGIITLQVRSNIDHKITVAENSRSWIEPVISERARGLSTNFYSFAISPSEEYDKREGEIIIQGEKLSERVKVYQTGEAVLLLTKNEYLVSDKGETIVVEIKSNFDFEVKMPMVDWVKPITARSTSSHTLYYIISPNDTYDKRETEIEFYDKSNNIKQLLKVIQAQKDAIVISQKEYLLSCQQQMVEVLVNSNVKYNVVIPDECNWIKQVSDISTRGLASSKLYFNIDENISDASRLGWICIRNNDNSLSETIEIKQKREMQPLTLHVEIAGSLPSLINEIDKYEIKELTLSGNLNGTDIRFLREMMGNDAFGNVTDGNLAVLDIKKATIVNGGDFYYAGNANSADVKAYLTQNNIISSEMFHKCNSLESIVLPESIIKLEGYAFDRCDYLTRISITGNLTNIGGQPFEDCKKMKEINVSKDNIYLATVDGVLFSRDMTKLWKFPEGKSLMYSIPYGVTFIDGGAFSTNYYYNNLSSVEIPESVIEIDNGAFSRCAKLATITLPSSLMLIGNQAFSFCVGLKEIHCKKGPNPPKLGQWVFRNVDKKECILYVPQNSSFIYQNTYEWKDFENIIEE